MKSFGKKFETGEMNVSEKKNELKETRENKKMGTDIVNMGIQKAALDVIQEMRQRAAQKFEKPDTYTGNRTIYDSGAAKKAAKMEAFTGGKEVTDPYTGAKLVMTKNEAKTLYGNDWAKHLAESDHVKPLEQIYKDTKKNVWNTTEDIRAAANNPDNLQVASRQFNNPKRSRLNEEYVSDDNYLEQKGVKLTEEGKARAIEDGKVAEQSINSQLKEASIKNIVKTGHEAGMYGAVNAGGTALTISGARNIVSVIKGEKSSEEAIKDTITDGGKAAVNGYMMSSALTVVGHTLSNSSSAFVRGLVECNVPAAVISAVAVTGDTLRKLGNGEITMQECMIELGDKGLNMAVIGKTAAVGQTLIPIPVVGAAVGALVGSAITSACYNGVVNKLKSMGAGENERIEIAKEGYDAAEQTKTFRKELKQYSDTYFKKYPGCFDDVLSATGFNVAG